MGKQRELPLWLTIACLALFVLALVGSCQAYYDCIDDGHPYYECRHYARSR
jgi:hypothetical protein